LFSLTIVCTGHPSIEEGTFGLNTVQRKCLKVSQRDPVVVSRYIYISILVYAEFQVFATCSTLDQMVKMFFFRFIPNEVGFELILLNLEIDFVKNRGNKEEVCSVSSVCAKR
jgi:hypothetical protein